MNMNNLKMRNAERGTRNANVASPAANSLRTPHSALRTPLAFTLIELLVVISIIGVLAGFTIPVLKTMKAAQYKKVARGELEFLQTALENYKAKYGFYPPGNQRAASSGYVPAMFSQLYYELAGTSIVGNNFVTLDGSASIATNSVNTAYGVVGFVNCTKGSGEDDTKAKNFLTGIRQQELNNVTNNFIFPTTILITSVGGPDDNYKPLNGSGLNPFRYLYPGVNNPGSYDLWVQLVISGKTNLVCNWSRQVIINSPLP